MSEDLYRTMLHFAGRKGLAKVQISATDSARIEFTELPPQLSALPKATTEVHVYPAVRDFRILESAGGMREMEAPEREAVRQFFASLAYHLRDFLAPPDEG
jgi:hypothetical protein